jgi:hypothetical protein
MVISHPPTITLSMNTTMTTTKTSMGSCTCYWSLNWLTSLAISFVLPHGMQWQIFRLKWWWGLKPWKPRNQLQEAISAHKIFMLKVRYLLCNWARKNQISDSNDMFEKGNDAHLPSVDPLIYVISQWELMFRQWVYIECLLYFCRVWCKHLRPAG